MMQNSSLSTLARADEAPADSLDRLLGDFFKSQLKSPWPPAPAASVSEPSMVVAARGPRTDLHQQDAHPAPRDDSGRARHTLAASVAILLGSCWYLSNGFLPDSRNELMPGLNGPGLLLPDAGAKNPDALLELREDKAKGGNGLPRPKLELP